VEKVIELLERAYKWLCGFSTAGEEIVILNELSVPPPRWETPEQREQRTGEAWPEDNAIYFRTRYKPTIYEDERWTIWRVAKHKNRKRIAASYLVQIICATDAGKPPDDWEPEKELKT
jgi:hypothetical protein